MRKKLAMLALGTCLSFGTAAICAAQTNQYSNPNNQPPATNPNNPNNVNNPNSATNPNSPNYNPNATTNPNANPNATNPNATNPNETGTANRMPATDANWLGMLLGGGVLSGLGLRLRKFARR